MPGIARRFSIPLPTHCSTGWQSFGNGEIGEQLTKILVRVLLSDRQVARLYDILSSNIQNRSNIVAACALQGIVDLACDGRVERARAQSVLDAALRSERKALSARARRLQKQLSP